MSPLVILLAVCGGMGLLLVAVGSLPRPAMAPGEAVTPREAAKRAAARVEAELRGKTSLIQDARAAGRSLESHALFKLVGLVAGPAVLGGAAFMLATFGAAIPLPGVIVAAAVGALLGWWLPDNILQTEAEKARRDFQQASESWLELVSQLVTAGEDTFGALVIAASYSDQSAFVTIRNSLRASVARGEPPWTGLRRLADERRLRFLDPFCAALEMAGTTGAGARQAVLSQVEAQRAKALHEADARAASSGEKMGAPLALIGGAFMILIGYPPIAGIMDSASLGTGGF